MEQEWRDLINEFNGKKPHSVFISMVVALLWCVIWKLRENGILDKEDAKEMLKGVNKAALNAYKEEF